MMKLVESLRAMIAGASRIVGFTGAGLSTESGIPDYRGKGGIWERYQPVYFQEFLSDAEKRRQYWERNLATWPAMRDAVPNKGHLFFADLAREGKLVGLITQNIDGLHEKSGVPSELIVNLHGSALTVICLSCAARYPAGEIADAADLSRGVPVCARCGGLLKPDTVSFGQPLRPADLARAGRMARECNLLIAMGSTLVVHPAAEIPASAKRSGARLVIVTLSETPLDGEADLVLNMRIGDLMEALGRG